MPGKTVILNIANIDNFSVQEHKVLSTLLSMMSDDKPKLLKSQGISQRETIYYEVAIGKEVYQVNIGSNNSVNQFKLF